ncbi:alpha/beta fold hydrolase [Oceanirhabdus sp. W0125-5]|uniref:alpha/beta fold hydrolase n=1 Tax=Oceanirhabdus sp. W0125-5 TaxID=2999116 RepID=UPI0022F2B9F9|nr:alpha/beta hydrolase [Oceanirhabdus sp. W0125-5]WBW98459.1 alpha/beta hydrolase [Oceanirhabdus sp. W0125-5]
MYYEEYGDISKPTIVFLHCAAIVEIYLNQYNLSNRYHIIVPHLYGSGKEVETDYEFYKNEKDIATIIKKLNKESVYIVGHSGGANLAVALVSHYPELFNRAIISSPMIDKTDKIAYRKAKYVSLMHRIVKTKFVAKIFVKILSISDKKRAQFFMDYWCKISKKTWINYYTDRLTFEKCPEYKNINVPILYLCGTKEIKEIKETVSKLNALNPYSSVKYLDGVGHEHPIKKKEELQKNILCFFKCNE